MKAVGPPRIDTLGIGIEQSEGVGKAALEQDAELCTLLVGEACVHSVGLGVLEIDLGVRDVKISTHHHRLAPVKSHKVLPEGILPLHSVIEPRKLVLGVGGIHRHDKAVLKLGGYHPSLAVVLIDTDAVGHRERLPFQKHRRSRISLFLGVIPIAVVIGQVEVDLALLQLGLLQAKDVGIHRPEYVDKPLAYAGAQAVYIPRNQLHRHHLLHTGILLAKPAVTFLGPLGNARIDTCVRDSRCIDLLVGKRGAVRQTAENVHLEGNLMPF